MPKLIDDENKFRLAYEQSLRSTGAYVTYMSSMGQQGIPDLFICDRGLMCWQELKFVSKMPARSAAGVLHHRVTGLQRLFLAELCERGGLGLVAVGYQESDGRLLVAFFWPSEIDKDGQISKAKLMAAQKAELWNGRDSSELMRRKAEELRSAIGKDKWQCRFKLEIE